MFINGKSADWSDCKNRFKDRPKTPGNVAFTAPKTAHWSPADEENNNNNKAYTDNVPKGIFDFLFRSLIGLLFGKNDAEEKKAKKRDLSL